MVGIDEILSPYLFMSVLNEFDSVDFDSLKSFFVLISYTDKYICICVYTYRYKNSQVLQKENTIKQKLIGLNECNFKYHALFFFYSYSSLFLLKNMITVK